MNYGLSASLNNQVSECLVLGVFTQGNNQESLSTLGATQNELIQQLKIRLKDKGQTTWHHTPGGQSILIYHCGEEQSFNESVLKSCLKDCITLLLAQKLTTALIALPGLKAKSPDWQLRQMVLQTDALCYQFLPFKKKSPKLNRLEKVDFYLPGANAECVQEAAKIAGGVALARDLGNLPGNVCTPTYLGQQAQKIAQDYPTVKATIHGPKEIHELGMNTFLAVAQGSEQEPRFIELHYNQGPSHQKPVILVGKGITFDAGGISIKPASGMDEMKYDMCGAASVLGTIKACAALKLPINVIGLVPSTENLINGRAVKPGDVITSLSGQTVEIINTDAEGRLILADALTYAERYNPEFVIDIATLTGAMVIALGGVYQGMMTKDDALAQLILDAAKESGDKTWRMPIDSDYEEILESPVADMLNATFDRSAGSITAACFLAKFTEKLRWAHLDIAGTAWISGKNRNATGRPVPLLTEILIHVAHSR